MHHPIQRALLGFAIATCFLVCTTVSAQAPLRLQTYTDDPYAVLKYDNSEHRVNLPEGDHLLAVENLGELDAEYWIRAPDGETIDHGTFCCDGLTRVHLPDEGTYTLQFNGQGRATMIRPELVDTTNKESTRVQYEAFDHRMAVGLARDYNTAYLCMHSPGPFDYQLTSADLLTDREGTGSDKVTTIPIDFDHYYKVLFMQGDGPFDVSVRPDPCEEDLLDPLAAEEHSPAVGFLPLLLTSLALVLRRRSRV